MKRTLLTALAFLGITVGSILFGGERSSVYLDIMQKSVEAYSPERIRDYVKRVDRDGITEHGYARLTANLGILISQGRMVGNKGLFEEMMDICVRELPIARQKNQGKGEIGNDFAVKEIVCCIMELEKAGTFPLEKTSTWRKALEDMKAEDIYSVQPVPGDQTARNWCVFGAASECARIMAGIGGEKEYADRYLKDQLRFFDENGMYRDPHSPMVYDLVTRLQYMAALDFGYDGPAKEAIEEQLLKSAGRTLQMQSVTGEIPYGGRSNQFLHNEAFYAAVCEYYASWMKERGDMASARRFKSAAMRAVSSLAYWLGQEPVHHVKNRYPVESGYGCETYAYFDKYMVTTASWAYLAWRFADDTIEPSHSRMERSTFITSDDFHRIIMNAGGYTVQFDWKAQPGYDSPGIGRVQKENAPPTLALASPCPSVRHPSYRIDVENEGPLAIAPCWDEYEIVAAKKGKVVMTDGKGSYWICRLGRHGLAMKLKGEGEMSLTLPVLVFDGERERTPMTSGSTMSVIDEGWICHYKSNGEIIDSGKEYGSRNGHLRRYEAKAKGCLKVRIFMSPE
ncbi:MAG: hypothetical protein IJ205_00215 [Bacteroidales bacterium]|nr:hypothetical protein [Bacteroidales bacterium]